MQKGRRDPRVFQYRFRFGQFHADARFVKAFDNQPGLQDKVDPPAQRPVEPGNAERLRPFAFFLRHVGQPPGIDPPIGRIEIAGDLYRSRCAVGLPQYAAVRRYETRMQDRELEEAARSQNPFCLAKGAALSAMSIIDMKAVAKSNEPAPNGKSVPSPAM